MFKIHLFIGIIYLVSLWSVGAHPEAPVPMQNASAYTRSSGCKWIPHNIRVLPSVPHYSVIGGFDEFNQPLYVGRVKYGGEIATVQVNSLRKLATFAYQGREVSVESFEILTGTDFAWVPAYKYIPPNAIFVGKVDRTNEDVHVGRTYYEKELAIGKIHSEFRYLRIAPHDKELSIPNFEVLVGPTNRCS